MTSDSRQTAFSVSLTQVVLFVLTFLTTLLAGYEFASFHLLSDSELWEGWSYLDFSSLSMLITWQNTFQAMTFACPVMLILFCHEMGHYITARRRNVLVTTPYFIPAIPIPGVGLFPAVGTFGAFIRMDVDKISSGVLLRIAAWGPIAGYVVAVPMLLLGMAKSPVELTTEGNATLGNSLLILLGEYLFHPDLPLGYDVVFSPLAMAGWFGIFLTSLNLIPIGQLDGGHIAYATFGKLWNKVSIFIFVLLIIMGVFCFFGWFFFAGLVYKLGVRHPDTLTDLRIGRRDRWFSYISLFMLITTFTPAPFVGMSLIDMIRDFMF